MSPPAFREKAGDGLGLEGSIVNYGLGGPRSIAFVQLPVIPVDHSHATDAFDSFRPHQGSKPG